MRTVCFANITFTSQQLFGALMDSAWKPPFNFNSLNKQTKNANLGGLRFLHNKCSNYVIDFSVSNVLWKKWWVCQPWGICYSSIWGIDQSESASNPSRLSVALLRGAHMGYVSFSEERGHLQALFSYNSSFLSRWSQSQISGRSQLQTRC